MKKVRVRFAPSPTGYLHIGGLRTALFNWLFARHHNGTFLVRIEDTDRERSHQTFVDSILDSLQWAGLDPDEAVEFQSKRLQLYHGACDQLLKNGAAYRCYCPPTDERIGEDYFKYDGRCRALQQTEQNPAKPHVVRFKFPLNQETISFHDLIKGEITFPADQFDDFVLVRTDGTPTYNFVVVVDDAAMSITHVIRGEDHISNTPKQILLYEALKLDVPQFAHIPLILGQSGQRLSKREAATGVPEYRQNGYLSDALCNYLVRLGWSYGDQEIFSRQQMIQAFSLDDVNKSNAIFDQQKLNWMNGHYIRNTSDNELLRLIIRDVEPTLIKKISAWSNNTICNFIALYKDRVDTLKELVEAIERAYKGDFLISQTFLSAVNNDYLGFLEKLIKTVEGISDFTLDTIKPTLKEFCLNHSLKFIAIAKPIRLALTGKEDGPGVFELLLLFGKEESVKRLMHFKEYIAQQCLGQ